MIVRIDKTIPALTRTQLDYRRFKQDGIVALGGSCVHCGEDDPRVLQFAHEKRDGCDRRRELGTRRGGLKYLRHLKNSGWEGILLLCANCHLRYDA